MFGEIIHEVRLRVMELVPTHARCVGGPLKRLSVKKIAAGRQTAYAIAEDGFLYAWGDNSFGQLGINSTIPMSTTPVRVIGIQNITVLSASVCC